MKKNVFTSESVTRGHPARQLLFYKVLHGAAKCYIVKL